TQGEQTLREAVVAVDNEVIQKRLAYSAANLEMVANSSNRTRQKQLGQVKLSTREDVYRMVGMGRLTALDVMKELKAWARVDVTVTQPPREATGEQLTLYQIDILERQGFLALVTNVFAARNISISDISSKVRGKRATITVAVTDMPGALIYVIKTILEDLAQIEVVPERMTQAKPYNLAILATGVKTSGLANQILQTLTELNVNVNLSRIPQMDEASDMVWFEFVIDVPYIVANAEVIEGLKAIAEVDEVELTTYEPEAYSGRLLNQEPRQKAADKAGQQQYVVEALKKLGKLDQLKRIRFATLGEKIAVQDKTTGYIVINTAYMSRAPPRVTGDRLSEQFSVLLTEVLRHEFGHIEFGSSE
ncbi:MAG: hypothetical protein K8I00_11565, partial [Candidatus Omnitrophica bacterium]|nr:hypothetical protein [Candidatus Omnitrophota bacterium]